MLLYFVSIPVTTEVCHLAVGPRSVYQITQITSSTRSSGTPTVQLPLKCCSLVGSLLMKPLPLSYV